MSQASAVSSPPASAQPLTAAMIGFGDPVHPAGEAVQAELDDLADVVRASASAMIGGM